MIRAKAQLDQLQSEIASVARKTGISSATKLALLAHHRETRDDEIPAVEWWDQDILNAKRWDSISRTHIRIYTFIHTHMHTQVHFLIYTVHTCTYIHIYVRTCSTS